LDRALAGEHDALISAQDRDILKVLRDPRWSDVAQELGQQAEPLKAVMVALAAHYFLVERSSDQRPIDPVARFHLGNGARLERINWLADTSEKGLREAHGLMVNYRYDLGEIERNHEAFVADGTVAASRGVKGLLRSASKGKAVPALPLLQGKQQAPAVVTPPPPTRDDGGAAPAT
ncbi:MAG: malonyl-CoA decarboxylase domain-containing protein, partial [Hyphomicrobium sp.]